MATTHPIQEMLELAVAAVNADDVQFMVVGTPGLRLLSGRPVSTSDTWAAQSGYTTVDPGSEVEDWVRSIAVAPVTGPSGEAGYFAAGHEDPDFFDAKSVDVLQRLATLTEAHLDRTAERVRLDRLGEVLRSNQEQLRHTQNRLLVSNEELEQFAYIAAHELVAPLRAVSLFAELLEPIVSADTVDRLQLSKCVKAINEGVADMDQQVRQLLQLSNVQSDTSQTGTVDLNDTVARALQTLAAPIDDAGALFTVGELPKVRGKAVPLQSVFANLFSNALRYRDSSRTLEVNVTSTVEGSNALISVVDNGVGVDDEARERIFQMFERASTTTNGSGIGLALSRRIVEAIGGDIALAESTQGGTEFVISLPLPTALPPAQ